MQVHLPYDDGSPAGGRYDNLVEQLDGPKADAMGFALGMERILLAAPADKKYYADTLDAFIVALGDTVTPRAFQLLHALRFNEAAVDMRFSGGSLKSQMRQADKSGARFVLIIGETEVANGVVIVKDMESGAQEEISLENIEELIKKVKTGKKGKMKIF